MQGLFWACQELYSDDRRVWNAIFEMVCKDFQDCELNGVHLEGDDVIFPIVLGNKGDWSYLVPWLKCVGFVCCFMGMRDQTKAFCCWML